MIVSKYDQAIALPSIEMQVQRLSSVFLSKTDDFSVEATD